MKRAVCAIKEKHNKTMKYEINKDLFPFSHFKPPIINGKLLCRLGALMPPPRSFYRDPALAVTKKRIESYDGKEIELLILSPKEEASSLPCLVYYHGGGFIFSASFHHYDIARIYAQEAQCKLIFVQYRLAPKNPHPTPSEDCYAALRWTFDNADALGVDTKRIAVGGDSAGGALAATVCQMARDRGTALPRFQLLIYPVTDRRMQTESNRIFTDTPMWNSKYSEKMWRAYTPDDNAPDLAYASPMEAASLVELPPAYVETAEFDCLRDEGIAYADALCAAGVAVTRHSTLGTIHGFDIVKKSAVTKDAIEKRIAFMREWFAPNGTHS